MKTIGLIGGMSWESSLEYYRILNVTVKERLGGLHSAKCILYSVEFAEIEELQHAGHWDEAAQKMVEAGQSLERAGADFLVLCTNTMHKLADEIEAGVKIPLLHIADAAAEAIKAAGISRVGLLGTRFTMEHDFYKGRLVEKHGLEVFIPDEADREDLQTSAENAVLRREQELLRQEDPEIPLSGEPATLASCDGRPGWPGACHPSLCGVLLLPGRRQAACAAAAPPPRCFGAQPSS